MSISARLEGLLNVRPDERNVVLLFVQYYFLLGIAFVFLQTIAFARFVATYGPTRLPFAYMGVAVMGSLLMFAYLWLSRRIPFTRMLVINLSFLVVANFIFWIGLNLPQHGAVVFLLPVWFQECIALGNLAFWGLAGRVFDVRQGKRVFGLIGAGTWIAATTGGILIAPLVSLFGTNQLLLLASLSICGALLTQQVITRNYFKRVDAPSGTSASSANSQNSGRGLLKNRYIKLIFALVMIWWLGFYFVDNIFYDRAAVQFPNTADLATFIGTLVALQGVTALVASFFLTGRVMGRFGVRGGLLFVPATLLLSAAALSIVGTINPALASVFWLAAFTKLISVAFGFSLDQSARIMLYQPLPDHERTSAQTLADGIVLSLAIGVAGVALLLFNTILSFGAVNLSYILLFILLCWVVIALLLAREYRFSLINALKKRYLDNGQVVNFAASENIELLRHQLLSPYPEAVLYAVNMLEQVAPEALSTALPDLLTHPSPDIRRETLRRIEQQERRDLLPAVEQYLERESSPSIREAAVRTLAALGAEEHLDTVAHYLDDSLVPMRRGALIGLLKSGSLEGMLLAGQRVLTLSASPYSEDRKLAAQVLGEIGIRHLYQPLLPLLTDPQPDVRQEALLAAGKLDHPHLWPLVIASLENPEIYCAAMTALTMSSTGSLSSIEAAFDDPDTSDNVLAGLARACATLREEKAVKFLLPRINFPNTDVRTQILRALSRSGYRTAPGETAAIHRQIENEAEWAAWLLAARHDVGFESEAALLSNGLEHELAQTRERIFYLLSFLYDSQTVLQAQYALTHGLGATNAYAMEVIDNLLSPELKGMVLGMLDPSEQFEQRHYAPFPQAKLSRDQRLMALLQEDRLERNSWIRTCALYTLGRLKLTGSHSAVSGVLSDPSPLVRETAQWTLSRFGSTSEIPDPLVEGNGAMLSTIEKVLILKTVGIFSSIPDPAIAEIAGIVEEQEIPAGQTIFQQGDLGDSMYIIISGKVRVHDGERLLNYLEERDVFGEMALLDPEPRVASVTAVEDTRLFRLGQEAFYQLLDNYSEVARGVIRVLTRYLRARVRDMAEMHGRIQQLEQPTSSLQPER